MQPLHTSDADGTCALRLLVKGHIMTLPFLSSFKSSWSTMSLAALASAVAVSLCGCPTDDGTGPDPSPSVGPEAEPDPEPSAGGDFFTDVQMRNLETVVPENGRGLSIALRDNGNFAIAYVGLGEGTFMCDLFGGGTVEGGDMREVRVAEGSFDGAITETVIDQIPSAAQQSVDMALGPNGLVFAYAGGEPANGYCGPSDLVVTEEGGAPNIVMTDSASASGCFWDETMAPETICDIGDTVGHYASIAIDDDGTVAVAFQDIHNGFAETDFSRGDLEMARGNGSYTVTSLLPGTGGGYHASIAFGPDGRIIAGTEVVGNNHFYDMEGNPFTVNEGLYVVVEADDGTFFFHNLAEDSTTNSRITVGHHDNFGFAAAYHDDIADRLIFVHSFDGPDLTPVPEPVAQFGRTGRSPHLGFLSDGTPVLAYRHCAGTNSDTCDTAEDGIRVAVRVNGTWQTQNLDGDDEDFEGLDLDMTIGADDTVAIVSHNTSRDHAVLHLLRR